MAGAPAPVFTVPSFTFADVGGLEDIKQEIARLVRHRLDPATAARYGVTRNGVLLYGPQGTGKTFLAQATVGEFRLNYFALSPTQLVSTYLGHTEARIRECFAEAARHRPALLFIDELDALGTVRQGLGSDGDPGGGGRSFNSIAIQLMQSIDAHRNVSGLILMAATNHLDAIDPALIRDGRFDLKLRLDLPDEATRARILAAHLCQRPAQPFPLDEFARRTAGSSAARLRGLVERAALFASEAQRPIIREDLQRALDESGGQDRPWFPPVQWADLIVEENIERELRALVDLLNRRDAHRLGVTPPTGLLLVGPPGTGKTMIAHLIATQTRRSFYPLTPADILGRGVGDSVKRLREVFQRAREHAPSIVFFDEIDGLLPANAGLLGGHDSQLLEQALLEMNAPRQGSEVFVLGATNHPERVEPRALRGGRLGERLTLTVPGQEAVHRLLKKQLGNTAIAGSLSTERLAGLLSGHSPANIQAVLLAAKRQALLRAPEGCSSLPPLESRDIEAALQSICGVVHRDTAGSPF